MSKNRDYTRFAKPENVVINDLVHREPVEPVESVEPEVIEEVEPTIGVVVDCLKLNVREDAETGASIVGTINASTELIIDMAQSTSEFYKVITSSGIEGFCMKKFIRVMS